MQMDFITPKMKLKVKVQDKSEGGGRSVRLFLVGGHRMQLKCLVRT